MENFLSQSLTFSESIKDNKKVHWIPEAPQDKKVQKEKSASRIK